MFRLMVLFAPFITVLAGEAHQALRPSIGFRVIHQSHCCPRLPLELLVGVAPRGVSYQSGFDAALRDARDVSLAIPLELRRGWTYVAR